MKLPKPTLPVQAGLLREISIWHESLHQVHTRLRPHFARPEVHQRTLRYLQAVLSDIPRKNGWQIAEQAREVRPYGIQRFLSAAVWDQDGVRDADPDLPDVVSARATAGGGRAFPRAGAG